VLSACNTIAEDKRGAKALSGLARAFFYAVARVLVGSSGKLLCWMVIRALPMLRR
jgi:CHAT domain-containing protein